MDREYASRYERIALKDWRVRRASEVPNVAYRKIPTSREKMIWNKSGMASQMGCALRISIEGGARGLPFAIAN